MIFNNNDFGVEGNVNFFTEANFILMNPKNTTLNQKIIFYISAFKQSGHMKRFLRLKKIYDEKLPLMKSREQLPPPPPPTPPPPLQKKKNINFLYLNF